MEYSYDENVGQGVAFSQNGYYFPAEFDFVIGAVKRYTRQEELMAW